MKPVKREDIVRKTAEKLGISEETVENVVSYYYKSLQKKMSSVEDMGIYVQCLGTFVLKKKRLQNKITGHEKLVNESIEDMSLVRYEIHMKRKENLEKMKKMLELMNEQDVIRKEYKDLRKDEQI